jgi:hypothetical protein
MRVRWRLYAARGHVNVDRARQETFLCFANSFQVHTLFDLTQPLIHASDCRRRAPPLTAIAAHSSLSPLCSSHSRSNTAPLVRAVQEHVCPLCLYQSPKVSNLPPILPILMQHHFLNRPVALATRAHRTVCRLPMPHCGCVLTGARLAQMVSFVTHFQEQHKNDDRVRAARLSEYSRCAFAATRCNPRPRPTSSPFHAPLSPHIVATRCNPPPCPIPSPFHAPLSPHRQSLSCSLF